MKQFILLIFLFIITAVHGQITLIPDMDFEQSLISQGIDTDGLINGQVLTADISDETVLIVNADGISSLVGIEDFTSLEILDCTDNQITELDVSNLTSLQILSCFQNQLTELDISNLTQLEVLDCEQNSITSLDLSNNALLRSLWIGNKRFDMFPKNNISAIDLSNNINLETLGCSDLQSLSSLGLSTNTALKFLFASYCDFDVLDLSNNSELEQLYIGNTVTYNFPSNNITSLDLSENSNLNILQAPFTTISNLNLKNGANSVLTNVELRENNNLFCIEVDDPVAANNGNAPYGAWETDTQIIYQNNCSLGVDDFNQEEISVLPNPARSIISIRNAHGIINEVFLYNMQGSLVKKIYSNYSAIDMSMLQSGMYLCKVGTSGGEVIKKIIIE